MRILIIEDESKTAAYLSKGLRESGYVVDVALNGEDGMHLARHHLFDLVILDVMLPKYDGWTVISEMKKIHPEIRVIFLTARDELENKVKGLELGADDYLIKPFAFSELLARMRSILRRGSTKQQNILSISDLKVDVIRHKVTRQSKAINLTPKEFSLLVFFMQRPGEVLSRTLIAEYVWDINFDSDTNIIDVAIKRLRQKIDDSSLKKLIHTIRGIGYVLEER